MNKQTTPSALTEEVSKNNDPKRPKAKQIFLGIDAHLARNQVARKKDNSGIQGVQSFSVEELLLFAQKQLSLAEEVYAVYEAGPLGNVLYRRLRELGIKAYVSAPECLEQGKRKHNKLDARKLVICLRKRGQVLVNYCLDFADAREFQIRVETGSLVSCVVAWDYRRFRYNQRAWLGRGRDFWECDFGSTRF